MALNSLFVLMCRRETTHSLTVQYYSVRCCNIIAVTLSVAVLAKCQLHSLWIHFLSLCCLYNRECSFFEHKISIRISQNVCL